MVKQNNAMAFLFFVCAVLSHACEEWANANRKESKEYY